MIGVLAPTAAKAVEPIKLPTTTESMVLYISWKKLPNNKGIEKRSIFSGILPSVINPDFFIAYTPPAKKASHQWRLYT